MKHFNQSWIAALVLFCVACASTSAAKFDSPEAAVRRLVEAGDDQAAAEELLGSGGFSLLRSGDEVADKAGFEFVRGLAIEQLQFEDVGEDRKIALLGNDHWQFPIPLVRDGELWRFDVEAGREEVLNRRVGRNELSTIATLRALSLAQAEYAAVGRDGNPPLYAKKLMSSPKLHDGLYWPSDEGEPASPLGLLVASATMEGYSANNTKPTPYHGYYFRLLTAQGPNAPGGAHNYLDVQGHLVAGFAVVAWPAIHGNSGVMTFLVNQQGIVFERDFGANTAKAAAALKAYDPDLNWSPTLD
jgi:hypothetical protein